MKHPSFSGRLGFFRTALGCAALVGAATSAHAVIIFTSPIDSPITDPNIVGAVDVISNDNANVDTVIDLGNALLDLPAETAQWAAVTGLESYQFTTGVTEFSGEIESGIRVDGDSSPSLQFIAAGNDPFGDLGGGLSYDTYFAPAGHDYVIAKYDGPNAGFIMFALDGEEAYIPAFPFEFWGRNPNQYELSNLTLLSTDDDPDPDPDPDPSPVPEPSQILVLGGLLGLGLLPRRRKAC